MNAKQKFLDVLTEQKGLTPVQADRVLKAYQENGFIKFNAHSNDFELVHGLLLDKVRIKNIMDNLKLH